MIKLKVEKILAFSSPIGTGLLNGETKFDSKTAFALAGFIEQMQPIIRRHNKTLIQTIKDIGGIIHDDGKVEYKSPDDKKKADDEIEKLSKAEVELVGDYLEMDIVDKLTIAEALLLKPLIKIE